MAPRAYNDASAKKAFEITNGVKVVDAPPDVTLRRATLADYQGVMDISQGLFEGHDYLPDHYQEYARGPKRHMFVAERNKQVVIK